MPIKMLLDNHFLRALREGPAALPDDLTQLSRHLRTIEMLLAEKAREHEQTWALALAASAEIETLHALEAAVAERAIACKAPCLRTMLQKLEIWRALPSCAEDTDGDDRGSIRDRLILSVECDLVRLAGPSRG